MIAGLKWKSRVVIIEPLLKNFMGKWIGSCCRSVLVPIENVYEKVRWTFEMEDFLEHLIEGIKIETNVNF